MRRRACQIADQAISAFTNLAIPFYAVNTLPTYQFAELAMALSFHLIVTGLTRAALGEQLFLGIASKPQCPSWRFRVFLYCNIVVLSLVALFSSIGLQPSIGLLALLGAPSVAAFEFVRCQEIASGGAHRSLLANSVWLVMTWSVVAIATVWNHNLGSTALLGLAVLPPLPILVVWEWLRYGGCGESNTGSYSLSYAMNSGLDFVLSSGFLHAAILLAGLGGATAAVAGLRASMLLFGPLGILFTTTQAWVLVQFGADAKGDRGRRTWAAIQLPALAVAWAFAIVVARRFESSLPAMLAGPLRAGGAALDWVILLHIFQGFGLAAAAQLKASGNGASLARSRLLGIIVSLWSILVTQLQGGGSLAMAICLGTLASAIGNSATAVVRAKQGDRAVRSRLALGSAAWPHVEDA